MTGGGSNIKSHLLLRARVIVKRNKVFLKSGNKCRRSRLKAGMTVK
jgi:hypothetical protein